jgi:hypothetical protein
VEKGLEHLISKGFELPPAYFEDETSSRAPKLTDEKFNTKNPPNPAVLQRLGNSNYVPLVPYKMTPPKNVVIEDPDELDDDEDLEEELAFEDDDAEEEKTEENVNVAQKEDADVDDLETTEADTDSDDADDTDKEDATDQADHDEADKESEEVSLLVSLLFHEHCQGR